MTGTGIATFLGGVAPDSTVDIEFAYQCGRTIGRHGLSLFHGGYNGLMESFAQGVAEVGTEIVAVTLSDKEAWGSFNEYTTRALYLDDLGQRLNTLLSNADIVLAMAGGVGTLHEVAAAIWYAGNVRRIPVVLMGARAERLLSFLKEEKWIYESPTRPIDFLSVVRTVAELDAILDSEGFTPGHAALVKLSHIERQLLDAALVSERYVRTDGSVLEAHFDSFRLCEDPKLARAAAIAIAEKVNAEVDAVVGIALSGASLATLVAQVLQKPLAMVRPEAKAYGTYAQIEGVLPDGCTALLIDDVVRSGANMLKACQALALKRVRVTQAACLLRRGMGLPTGFAEDSLPLHALFTLPDSQVVAQEVQCGEGAA